MSKLYEPAEPPSPWLLFFREVRRLAAELDAREAQEAQSECREMTRT
jgi:hypothetical protein